RGFWFRYCLESTSGSDHTSALSASLWAAMFNRRSSEQNLGLRREYPIGQLTFEGQEDSILKLGEGTFSPCQVAGRVDEGGHCIEWDLTYVPCETTYHHVSRAVIQLARPSSFVCSPNLDTRFTGRIVVDGESIILDQEPGCQSHLWGRKHVDD